jgi:two-component system, OmpR family, phosphate regulon sensor histidine kinase PhoR
MTYLAFGIALILAIALIRARSRHQEDTQAWQAKEKDFHDQAKKTLKNHQRETRRLLDALPDPFFSISQHRKIIRHNNPAAQIFKDRDLENRSIQQVFLDPSLIALIDKAITSGTRLSRSLQLSSNSPFSSQGKVSHWDIDIYPVSLQTDQIEVQLLMRDTTASVVADQIRQDFVANASHELRTPLSIISGYLENLTEEGALDHKPIAEKMLGTMSRHVDRINRIVDDMLVISKLESNDSAPLNIEKFPLSDCVHDILERLDLVIKKQNAIVESDINDVILTGDFFYWTQLLFNLVENALKQNSNTPVKIQIKARKNQNGATTITVLDNGIGIPRNDLPFIFKRFYRVEKHHSQNQVKGTGLGLSIVKRAVEAHGGTITATSTPGVETAFKIELPVHE